MSLILYIVGNVKNAIVDVLILVVLLQFGDNPALIWDGSSLLMRIYSDFTVKRLMSA